MADQVPADGSSFRPSSVLVGAEWRPLATPAGERALRFGQGRRVADVNRPCETCDADWYEAARRQRARRRRLRRRDRAASCPPELLGCAS